MRLDARRAVGASWRQPFERLKTVLTTNCTRPASVCACPGLRGLKAAGGEHCPLFETPGDWHPFERKTVHAYRHNATNGAAPRA
jgi:hypothetical protein